MDVVEPLLAMTTVFVFFVDFYCVVAGGVVGLVHICFWWCQFVYMCDRVVVWVRLCFWESVLAYVYFCRLLFFLCLILCVLVMTHGSQ